MGVNRNEQADQLAKQPLNLPDIEMDIPLSIEEFKAKIRTIIKRKWQKFWKKEERGRHFSIFKIKLEMKEGILETGERIES